MFSLLALAAQTATLSNEPAKHAMACGAAAVVAGAETDAPLRMTSHYMYFVMRAAEADPGDKSFLLRIGELAGGAAQGEIPSPEAAKKLLTDCDREYPLARAATAPKLPADAFDRDVMCMGTLSLLSGAAEEIKKDGDDNGAHDRIGEAIAGIAGRLTDDALAQRGMNNEEKFTVVMGEQLKASLRLGNPETIARACGAAI